MKPTRRPFVHERPARIALAAALAPSALSAVMALARPAPAQAQDRFGAAVAVAGRDIAVVKPGTSQGDATVSIFRRDPAGEWQRAQTLGAMDPVPGEGLAPSIAAAGDLLLVAAADPDARWGAHAFRLHDGRWVPAGRIPLNVVAGSAEGARPVLDLAGLMRFAQPPARTVTISGDGSRAAVSTAQGVLVASPAGSADWTVESRFGAESLGESTVPRPIAVTAGLLAVGMPAAAAVQLFERQADATWRAGPRIAAPLGLLAASAGFGAAVLFDGDDLIVAAPAAGMILTFGRAADGFWRPAAPVREAFRPAPAGPSLSMNGTELWIGDAPSNDGPATVRRFSRSPAGWQAGAPLDPGNLDLGMGVAVDVRGDLAVVGGPGSNGRVGAARVLARSAGGAWAPAGLLEPAGSLDAVTGASVTCSAGKAAAFSCESVDLLAFLPSSAFGAEPGEFVSDLWGWTDPQTHREYALVGRSRGVAIVDVTDAATPRYLGVVAGRPAGPRDIKVFRDHMFFVGDGAGEHGLLVFDLKRLRNLPAQLPATFEPDARYDGIASAHNLVLDTGTGTAIPVGSSAGGNTCGGGLHMIDVNDPLKPAFAGCYTDTEGLVWQGRTHDAQCTPYRGPDESWRGRDICFVANETALRIVDITDRAKPVPISVATYPDRGYIHQGWLTEDQRYFFMNDEADELVGLTARTRTLIWDVADLDDPILAGQYLGPDAATDHNLYIRGNLMYLANYQAGLRVVDIADPLHPREIGFFDTTPFAGNPPGWVGGAWTAFPFLDSGTVLVSSIHEGLFLLRPRMRPVS